MVFLFPCCWRSCCWRSCCWRSGVGWLIGLCLFGWMSIACSVLLAMPGAVLDGTVAADQVDFNRDIRPLLSTTCFTCHGPDDSAREADLRLDRSEDAYESDAFVPGEPARSAAIERIFSDDDDLRMPPVDAKKQLTAAQRERIRQWVKEGAHYARHWALVAPRRPEVPVDEYHDWQRNAIDAFVARRLRAERLKPSPEADRYTLVRRLFLDLIGLPPSPDQADAFIHDTRPDAYERLVERLLASPHYGERWARRWLDIARYSDTNGYEKDRPRAMWPYRDWVIQALNADMPFDQFTIEQVAGDMLPAATLQQRIATGFHRNTMINEEGGIDPEEFRFLAMVDRLATTGTAWLGLTVGCAQCHTHKYDPISQTEYYRLMAMINNANEVALEVPTQELVAKREALEQQIAEIESRLEASFPVPSGKRKAARDGAAVGGPANVVEDGVTKGGATEDDPTEDDPTKDGTAEDDIAEDDATGDGDRCDEEARQPTEQTLTEGSLSDQQRRAHYLRTKFAQWQQAELARVVDWTVLTPRHVASNLPSVDLLKDGSVLVSGDQTKNDTFTVTLAPGKRRVSAIRLEVLPHSSLPQKGPGRRAVGQGASAGVGDFFLSRFTVTAADESGQATPLELCKATESFAAKDRSAALAIDDKGDTGWSIAGRSGERHVAVFQFSKPVDLEAACQLLVRLEHESFYPSGLGRFRLSVTEAKGDIKASSLPEDIEIALLTPPPERTDQQQETLLKYYLSVAPELAAEHKEIARLRGQKPPFPETYVMQQRPERHARQTRRHHRGEFLSPKETVEPGVPAALHSLRAGSKPDRLALARWLVDQDNPLTARVVVNRHWQALFGIGLVRTTDDFGAQGELPSHPRLLDWLAVEFMEQGWSVKQLHRLLVTSATYRQTSRVTPELLARDPENRLLARGPRLRLDAELVRDTVLSASGQLSSKIGGPSVFPVQPAGITEESYGPLTWTVSQGEDRYRRGLYTFNKRTAPYPAFALFDAPSGEACIARRVNSNTPLQALNLLNDPVVLEAAQAMARGVMQADVTTPRTDVEKATELFRRCVTRPPTAQEMAALLSYFKQQKNRFDLGQSTLPIIGGGDLHVWEFDQDAAGWAARHQCELAVKDGQLRVASSGIDPFFMTSIQGPLGTYRLVIEARFGVVGKGELFWTTKQNPAAAKDRSVAFELVANAWHTYEIPVTVTAPLTSLRIDPGAKAGESLVKSIRLSYGTTDVQLDERMDRAALAAWTLVARAVLNLDETITKP